MILSEAFIEKVMTRLIEHHKLKNEKAFVVFNDIYAMITLEEQRITKRSEGNGK